MRAFAEIAAQRPDDAFHLPGVLSYTVRRPLGDLRAGLSRGALRARLLLPTHQDHDQAGAA